MFSLRNICITFAFLTSESLWAAPLFERHDDEVTYDSFIKFAESSAVDEYFTTLARLPILAAEFGAGFAVASGVGSLSNTESLIVPAAAHMMSSAILMTTIYRRYLHSHEVIPAGRQRMIAMGLHAAVAVGVVACYTTIRLLATAR